MFDFVEKHKRLIMFALVLVIAPAFVLVGVNTFDSNPGGLNIAEVNGKPIYAAEFDQTLNQQRERMRQNLGRNFDPALFDTPAIRKELLDQMIAERAVFHFASRNHMSISNAQLNEVLLNVPDLLGPDGKVSKENLARIAAAMGTTPDGLLARVSNDLTEQQVARGIEQSAFVSNSAAARFAQVRAESREVSRFIFPAGQYASQVQVTPQEIEDYYKSHTEDFRTPEQVRAEYVLLTRDAVAAQIAISAEEVQRQYEEATGAKTKLRAEVRAKAEAVLAELRKDPQKFAELAKQHSQDSASAVQGGDLDYFARGSMVKPFEDTVFKLKPKEISPIVETEFGFHIIQMTDVRKAAQGEERRASHILFTAPPAPKDAAAGKAEIERALRQQQITKKFAEEVENFKDVAYEQPETLQPLVDRFKLKLETSTWLSKTAGHPPIDNPRLLNALFTGDALSEKRNTEAVEVGPGRWIVARIVEHKPASIRPLEDVRREIDASLREQKALAMALQLGQEKLKALQAGQATDLKWSNSIQVSRDQANEANRELLVPLFKADTSKLPAYVGVEVPRAGYVLLRISKVTRPEKIDDARLKAASYGLNQLTALQQRQALVSVLRERADVKVFEDRLAKKAEE